MLHFLIHESQRWDIFCTYLMAFLKDLMAVTFPVGNAIQISRATSPENWIRCFQNIHFFCTHFYFQLVLLLEFSLREGRKGLLYFSFFFVFYPKCNHRLILQQLLFNRTLLFFPFHVLNTTINQFFFLENFLLNCPIQPLKEHL